MSERNDRAFRFTSADGAISPNVPSGTAADEDDDCEEVADADAVVVAAAVVAAAAAAAAECGAAADVVAAAAAAVAVADVDAGVAADFLPTSVASRSIHSSSGRAERMPSARVSSDEGPRAFFALPKLAPPPVRARFANSSTSSSTT
jgi:hypothetical protein